jgi:spore germination cell wall hydrolase CwlJ-like protein
LQLADIAQKTMRSAFRTVFGAALALIVSSAVVPSGAAAREAGPTEAVEPAFEKAVTAEKPDAAPVSLGERVAALVAAPIELDAQVMCMAKVVHHEAANQPLIGQLAVAQLMLNRIASGSFPKTVCGVANQPGQFFHIARYHAPSKDPRWAKAVAIARIALGGDVKPVAPGALYYHATYVRPSWMMKRVRVAQIGQHIFYR